MEDKLNLPNIEIEIEGLGMILYSPKSAAHIKEGEDYFQTNYYKPEDVEQHCLNGTIVGFCTSPGRYILCFREGYPDQVVLDENEFRLRLAVRVFDGKLCVRDLYNLLDWSPECPPQQIIPIEDGIYHVTLCSRLPISGILGRNQEILVYLNKLEAMPELKYGGVPTLCE